MLPGKRVALLLYGTFLKFTSGYLVYRYHTCKKRMYYASIMSRFIAPAPDGHNTVINTTRRSSVGEIAVIRDRGVGLGYHSA